jgi:hypothetical protein
LTPIDERFDLLEIRAGRNMGEAEHYWKYHLTRIPAARLDIAPDGFVPKVRRVLDAVLLRGGLR